MSNFTIALFLLFIMTWVYCILSIFRGEFKEEQQKIFWRIGIIFVPFLALFYLFMKKDLLE